MPRFMRSQVATFALLAATLSITVAPPASQAEEAAATERIEVGQVGPDFTLPDPDGRDHAASALRGEKNLLLVFFRGAW